MHVGPRLMLAALTALPAAAAGAQAGSPTDYPEMSREQTLPVIARGLRDYLLDSASVTNFVVCYPAVKVKVRGGRPVRWTVMFSLNAKNSYGGYTGAQQLAAIFRPDAPVQIISTGMPPGLGDYGKCTRVPDAEIRRLMEPE